MLHDLHDPPAAERLTEHVRDWRSEGVTVDRQGRYVRNVALAGSQSANGYRYSERALQDAVPLYAGKPVFLDHARAATRPYDRSTRDLVGSIVRPRYENGRVRGDIRVIDTEAGRTFLALADSDSAAVGMSHVVLAERSTDGRTVERLHDVVSVDAVAFPASTKSLRESQNGSPHGSPDDAELAALTAEREQLQGEVNELRRERDRLSEQIEADRLLLDADLPPRAVTDLFREQLRRAAPQDRPALIDERRALLSGDHRASRPLSTPREPSPQEGISDESFVATIRRR